MKVKEAMTVRSLKYCSPETKLHNAAKTMKAGNCGALPVVDKDKKVVGMITDRDITLALASKRAQPLSSVKVGQIMTPMVHTVNGEEELSSALRQMRTNQVGRVPVVDRKGKLRGIVSLNNLLNQATNNRKVDMGILAAPGENLLKTIRAITDRYSNSGRSARAR
jgi:CBS domain-containing protein